MRIQADGHASADHENDGPEREQESEEAEEKPHRVLSIRPRSGRLLPAAPAAMRRFASLGCRTLQQAAPPRTPTVGAARACSQGKSQPNGSPGFMVKLRLCDIPAPISAPVHRRAAW